MSQAAFKEVIEVNSSKFEQCLLGQMAKIGEVSGNIKNYDAPVTAEIKKPIINKLEGLQREQNVYNDLRKTYLETNGYSIKSEVYLRNEDGKILQDTVTNEARRIDFVVVKNDKVVMSVEVTSMTADKTKQIEKEERIRANGGNYIKIDDGRLLIIPNDVHTKIERRD